ncbi:hypothetical protein OQA88_3664 [Cercophora sp. LCS_1]
MAKRKNKNKKNQGAPGVGGQPDAVKQSVIVPVIVKRWNDYFGSGGLADWQRLCVDVGLTGDYSSKTKCRKACPSFFGRRPEKADALKKVHVNIVDLLDAVPKGEHPHRFPNRSELALYTTSTKKIYPKHEAKKGPLKVLLREIFWGR